MAALRDLGLTSAHIAVSPEARHDAYGLLWEVLDALEVVDLMDDLEEPWRG